MKLSTRLFLLILGCLLPILTAQVYSQVTLYAERHEQFSGLLLRQAELANADIGSILEGIAQLATSIGDASTTGALNEQCPARLAMLRQHLPQYHFFDLVAADDGTVLCAAGEITPGADSAQPDWLRELPGSKRITVGKLVADPSGRGSFLPVAIPLPSGDGNPRVLIAGLDADWLVRHLEATSSLNMKRGSSNSVLMIADRDGTIVGRVPPAAAGEGPALPAWFRPLIDQSEPGVTTITNDRSKTIVAAYVPMAIPTHGLTVIESIELPAFTMDIDEATHQDLLVITGSAVVALLLAWVAGRRFIYQPTQELLRAARAWRDGNLSAPAVVTDPNSEFTALADSFNAMAARVQAREQERQLQATVLEAQVDERTRKLSETNNRLQVEIAGRERTEAALHQAQKLQAVGQLAGGIAHDFNNMLATVLGNLELMERRVEQAGERWPQEDSDRLMRLIERATGAVTRGGHLTSRLLAFSRRQRLAARPTDINALLRELITLATSTLGRRVEVVSELTDDLWPAMVDPSQVEAAILNLCLNARDAMPEGGRLTILTRNAVVAPGDSSDLAPGEYVQVCIRDTGYGMTPEVNARAFEPFFTTKGPGAGSGLGLSQVYGMVRQSGGGVTIDSAPGKGTRVTLSLPHASAEQSRNEAAAPAVTQNVTNGMGHELVLVVDDDDAVRQVTVEMARDLGCEVVQATGGEAALSLMTKLSPPPKMILLDYAMPGMNGLQLARSLRERRYRGPIALVTGYAELSESDLAAAELAGVLRKPFTIKELQVLLTKLRSMAGAENVPETV